MIEFHQRENWRLGYDRYPEGLRRLAIGPLRIDFYSWFHHRMEGQNILTGINFFSRHDPGSRGFVILTRKHVLRFRWSKRLKRFFIYLKRRGWQAFSTEPEYVITDEG